jgi:plastocyanin
MRKLLLLGLIPLSFAVAAPATAATTQVSIKEAGFIPAQVTIANGDTVTWTNNDTEARQVVADGGQFTSPAIKPGDTYSFRFTRAGTVNYHDQIKIAQKGTISVQGAGTRSVTIAAAKRTVTLGSALELSGNTTGARAGQQVIVVAKPYGREETRTPVVTEADGGWTLVVRPRIRTEYRAEWGNTMSNQAPIVFVRPAVQLSVLSARAGRFYTKVSALRSYRGKLVTFQRLRGSTWVKVRRVRLGLGGVARFTARLPRTARVRVLVPSGPGYIQGYSRTALVKR